VPTPKPFEAKFLYDSVRSFAGGVDSGTEPLKLTREQLAGAINATTRGTFISPRPAFLKMSLNFGGDTTLQAAATQNLFQGVCYYKPDAGLECLMAAVAGRLFQFQVDGTNVTVSEKTNPNLTQSPTVPQAWLWQSERWVNFNDGVNLPLFFDGTTTRRSVGSATTTVGTTSGFTAGAVNVSQPITLTGPYLGPVPGNVSINGYKYLVTKVVATTVSAFTLTIKNAYGGDATRIVAAGTSLLKPSAYYGYTLTAIFGAGGAIVNTNINVTTPYTGPVGGSFNLDIGGHPTRVNSTSNGGLTLNVSVSFSAAATLPSGSVIKQGTITWTSVAITNDAISPEPTPGNSTPPIHVQSAYTGAVGDFVFGGTNSANQLLEWQITASATDNAAQYTASVTNLTAPQGDAVVGGTALINTSRELPVGRMGAYIMNRNVMCLADGFSFIIGDDNGASSGTLTYGFRDAVLSVVGNTFLAGGGVFRVPSAGEQITAIVPQAILDAALGQGPILVFTPGTVFSCNAPLDRNAWLTITNPIVSPSLICNGGLSQDSTVTSNSDTMFRAVDGIRSLILGRRDFDTWGNTAISFEVSPTLDQDDKSLLGFCSAMVFDNRHWETANPIQSPLGVYHPKMTVLNFDQTSTLRGKAPAVYDGVSQDLNVLKFVKGKFAGVERGFAFCMSADLSAIELWEILPSNGPTALDNDNGTTPIVWEFVTAALNFYENDPRKRDFLRLLDGEIRAEEFSGPVTFEAFYKPDQWPLWVPWHSWTEPFDPNNHPGFRPTMGLGEPNSREFDNVNNRPLRECTTVQVRLRITGHCKVLAMRFLACTIPATDFAPPSKS
jgi:hypothetical protein